MTQHYVLTRSAYGPEMSIEENKLRLAMTTEITARSLASQTEKRWTWLVLVNPKDPLLEQRLAALSTAGADLLVCPAPEQMQNQHHFDKPYGPWKQFVEWTEDATLTTRLDDDDALARDTLARVRAQADYANSRRVFAFPNGWCSFGAKGSAAAYWPIPPFTSLIAPPKDRTTIMDVSHTSAPKLGPVTTVASDSPSWLYVRHRGNRSSPRAALEAVGKRELGPVPDRVRERIDVDWDLVDSL